ncbi:hypothetical protein [Clostridium cadaveris]|uniref:hypothetical protein n=1 Tax=Clostridium cadaveris TaxID=1529 RepID=UPI0039948A5E
MRKYEYMVVYSFQNGIGRIKITMEKPIENYKDVEQLDTTIRKANGTLNAFVTNFKLLREYEE